MSSPKDTKKEPSGVLIVNKPQGFTSHDVINKIRRLFGTRRVGHTGTLDPLATGVLVVLVGRAAKAAEYIVAHEKEYVATLRLGLESDTEDISGNIISSCDAIPSRRQVIDTCAEFVGDIMQTPPMYSALKVGGQKLCDLARRGVEIEREARPVKIYSIDVTSTDAVTDYILRVKCSSGTYIRTLCADIGKALGCGGVMASLCRSAVENFNIDTAFTLEQLEQLGEEAHSSALHPVESLFSELPQVTLPEFYEKLSKSGCQIYQKKIKTEFAVGEHIRMKDINGCFYALGQVRDYPEGSAIKAIKRFDV